MDEQPKIQKVVEDFIAGIEWFLRLLKEKRLIPLLSLLTIGLFAESRLGKAKPVIKKIAGSNLAELFDIATGSCAVACLFVFDQFEQFFTQNRMEEQARKCM